ncbi:MAG TPA: efflux RND transporter permease subunit [Acidobacteriaceae bacterium]|jgi:CzcA family heavy metal efflux pump|nr:efflux RND transporter permease subunit [Acidobacteriaceae bacterium]
MWIVRLALRRPLTFIVLAILIFILGIFTILRTPTDIFPNIDIPVVSIVWGYTGLSPDQMSTRITANFERALTTTVNNIEHIESQSLTGISVIKVFFHPGTDINAGLSQITAIGQTLLRSLPPGTQPPLIITYNASSVPILQLGLSGKGLSEQKLFDLDNSFLRTQLATVQGAASPWPYGGKQRQIQVDINSAALQAKRLSPADVVNALGNQNLILPAGTEKIGMYEYQIETNSAPRTIEELNNLPIKTVDGATVYMKDVAHVRDGFPPQTNIVRVNGQRAVLVTILKAGDASTLDIISRVRKVLPIAEAGMPKQLRVALLSDQSIFVRGAITGVAREAIIAALLTAIMILVFLGSWRSTLIIAVSIPLSILVSFIVLGMLGETINLMTLGGMALAVGILVDDATVEIENINRNLEMGKEIEQAILDGAAEIAIPAFVSTLSICIVFVPMFFLGGVARYLFVPLAEAVVFAMLASYFLSRTVVPTMAKYLLQQYEEGHLEQRRNSSNPFVRWQMKFEDGFEHIRTGYRDLLAVCLEYRSIFVLGFFAFCALSLVVIYPWLGQDFFPDVDGGQFKLHVRAQTGTRIEETARLCDEIDKTIREVVPQDEMDSIIDNIGVPYSGINLSYSNSATIGSWDADILVSLQRKHHPTADYVAKLRQVLANKYPGVTFYFLPTDMVSQILNFGLPAPLDIQIVGNDAEANHAFAEKMMAQIRQIPGTVDLRIQQAFNEPNFTVDVDRTKAQQVGFTQRDIAGNLLVALSGSFQTSPSFWLDWKNGVSYEIAVQEPQYHMDTLQNLENIPITNGSASPQILANVATLKRGAEPSTVSHYNVMPVIDIYGAVQGTDLRTVATQIDKIVKQDKGNLPRGSQIIIRGQIETMRSSTVGLIGGLLFAIGLVYLLIVVNFQSWLDPFIIVAALPAALAGIVWFLFITGTHISVPALTGSIMCMGVATANSILVVSFAREQMEQGHSSLEAALVAGYTRFRPVLMTALAMIIGMVPMALGLGDGGEQNAPLGRAVIGGLLFATAATLFFVPVFFSIFHKKDTSHQVVPSQEETL